MFDLVAARSITLLGTLAMTLALNLLIAFVDFRSCEVGW